MGRIVVHVVPRAKQTEVVGLHGDAIRIRVAAPPVDGAANVELVRFLADRLRVSQQTVHITGGTTGRRKTVSVAGVAPDVIRRALLTADGQ